VAKNIFVCEYFFVCVHGNILLCGENKSFVCFCVSDEFFVCVCEIVTIVMEICWGLER